jgi:hypothetical protein
MIPAGAVNASHPGTVHFPMIVFDLACTKGHRFEGWFASGEAFDQQQAGGLVRCPVCDDADVSRLPSAHVAVTKGARLPTPAAAPSAPPPAPPAEATAGLPAEVVAKLREIVRATENVGPRFPEEARRIHYNEAPARAIRGQASPEEAESLREEGIDFAPLPPFLTEDRH